MQKTGIDSVWGHQSLSPQEVFDSLGEAAGSLCAAHAALTKCIVTIATADGIAPDIKLPTFNFAVESDGKVTVSDTPYAP